MRVLFLVPYPIGKAPSQRFRFEQYFEFIEQKGISYEIRPFWDERSWDVLYKSGHILQKALGLLKGYLRRIFCLLQLRSFDKVFVHREVAPLGFPFFEWLISKVFRLPMVYDFDDAIWLNDQAVNNNAVPVKLKYPEKTGHLCRWSSKVSCGNSYLADFALKFNNRVLVNPTTIDATNYHLPQHQENSPLVIGWTGTHSTMPYLYEIIPLLKKLRGRYDFILKVICNASPEINIPGFQFIKWERDREIEVLNTIDIGIMPLPDNAWTKGKCGFKILQYMALEKATIASAVGINTEIIDHGENGLICYNEQDWVVHLERLLTDESLRLELGKNARIKIMKHYSVQSNYSNFLDILS